MSDVTLKQLSNGTPLAFGVVYMACGLWNGEQLPPAPPVIVREYLDRGWFVGFADRSDTNERIASVTIMPSASQRVTVRDALLVLKGVGATHGILYETNIPMEVFGELADAQTLGSAAGNIAEGVRDAVLEGSEAVAQALKAIGEVFDLNGWLLENWKLVALVGGVVLLLVFSKGARGAVKGALGG